MTAALLVNGLAPSPALAPSPSLAPQASIFTGGPVTPHKVAMGVGAGGALIDVSSYVEFGEGVGYTWGRQAQWDDTAPGTFTFTLDNSDGRFTPGNPTSPLASTVQEGTPVVWQLGSRIVAANVLSVEFATSEDAYNLLKVTCDDMLGAAGRHELTTLADGLLGNSPAKMALAWKLDEGDGPASVEVNGSSLGPFQASRTSAATADAVSYGVQQAAWLPGTAITVTAQAGETVYYGTSRGNTSVPSPAVLPAGWPSTLATDGTQYRLGFWNLWVYPGSTVNLAVTYKFAAAGGRPIILQVTPAGLSITAGTAAVTQVHAWTAVELQAPQWVSLLVSRTYNGSSWVVNSQAYINDAAAGSQVAYADTPGNASRTWDLTSDPQPVQVELQVVNTSGTAALSGTVQRVSYTLAGTGNEDNAAGVTLDQRRSVLDFISDELSSATYAGTTLSTPPIGFPDVSGRSVLDVYNDIQRTEQGHLFVTTSGSLTSAAAQIQVRARDRPTTVKASFDVTTELDGLPTFLRDITNLANRVQVQGSVQTVTVTDPTVTQTNRYLAANLSETVLNSDPVDLRMWGQDRLLRGKTANVRAEAFTVDLYTTPTDRSGDVLALVPGDRVRLTNLPAARFGMSRWDGWVLGLTEAHPVDAHRVTVYLQPCLPAPAVLDTGWLINNGGELTLTAALTASATSMTLASRGGDLLSTAVPYTLAVDTEHVRVTAVDSSGLVATITRGADGTTAATHTTTAVIEVLTTATLGF